MVGQYTCRLPDGTCDVSMAHVMGELLEVNYMKLNPDKGGADDERARIYMRYDIVIGQHSAQLAKCQAKDDVERYVIKCGYDVGCVPQFLMDAAWQAALILKNQGTPSQHIISGVYGAHG